MGNAPTAATSWRGVLSGVLISSIAAYQLFKLPPVLPDYLTRYPVQPTIAALYMSVYALIGAAISGPLGRILDRAGLDRALRAAAGLFLVAGLLALWRPDSWILFLFSRSLEGLAFAACAIVGPVVAARSARPADLALVTGLIAGWVPLGQIVGGLAFAIWPSWRFPWLVGLLMAIGLFALAPAARRMSALGRQAVESGTSNRLKHIIAAGIFMLWSVQFMAFMTWLPTYAEARFDLDLRSSTGAYLLPVLFVLMFNILTGWVLGRGVPLLSLLAGALVSQALVWALAPVLGGPWAIPALVLYGIGAGVAPACLFLLPHFIEGGRASAANFGILMVGRNLGSFVGPVLLPLLVDLRTLPPYELEWFLLVTTGAIAMTGILARLRRQGMSR